MSIEESCSLCCTQCDDYNLLKNESGETNKFYEITVKYFDPMLLTDEGNSNLHHIQVLCQDCWYHINEFHEFQQTVLKTRMLWEHKEQIENLPIEIKSEDCENLDTNTHCNTSFDVSNDEDDRFDSFENQRLKTESVTMLEDTTESIDNQANEKEEEPRNSKLSQETDKTKYQNELPYKTRCDRMPKKLTNRVSDDFIAQWRPELVCDICNETANNYDKLRSHFKEKHKTGFYIKCCEKKFVHRYRLVNHIQLHLNPETNKCGICGKTSTTKYDLKQHMKVVHEDTTIEIKSEDCENVDTNAHCNTSFDVSNDEDDRLDYFENQRLKTESVTMLEDTTESIDNQVNEKEEEPKNSKLSQETDKTKNQNELPYKTRCDRMPKKLTNRVSDAFIAQWKPELVCDICSETANNFDKLRSHFKEKHKTGFYIKCCEKKFVQRYRLVNHIQLHLNPETNKCGICGKTSTTKYDLKQHMKVVHEDTKQVKCDICEKLFKRKHTLKRHLLTHATGSKDFICSECGNGYVDEELLKLHIKSVHNADRVCDQCGKIIHGLYALKKHLMDHAGIEHPKFPCDVCGLELSTRTILKRHKASYHNDGTTIYICGVCGKVTASEHALATHKKVVHVEERKHKCTYCEKAFKSPRALREHIATHTGKHLYQCPHCPQTFKGSSHMYHHRKKVHPVEYEEAKKNRLNHTKINNNQVKKLVVM